VDVLARQAHPGPAAPPYRSLERKVEDAARYQREEGIPWPVLVDDLAGTVHQVYGSMADPTYLIDADGRVAYYNMWTYAPSLDKAIAALLAQGERGVVAGDIDHVPHLSPAMTDGWKGIRRGLPQSFTDLETAAPGMASGIWLGYQLRPLLAPLTLRTTPLPAPARRALTLALVSGVGGALVAGARRRRRD